MGRPEPKLDFLVRLPGDAAILDVGCWNYSLFRYCASKGMTHLRHHGVDFHQPTEEPPPGYAFKRADLDADPLPFSAEVFDGVVASHIVEHLSRPLALFDEMFRVLKPGGLLFVECPSERSLWLPSMPFQHREGRSLNFFDDPTHVGRPHTPQSLYRLFRMYDAEVLEARHLVSRGVLLRSPWLLAKALLTRNAAMLEETAWWAFGFAVFGIARKTTSTPRRYVFR